MTGLSGKTAWVIGGGSGLGAASARELAALGARVVLSGRRLDALQRTLAQIGGTGECRPLDVANVDGIESLATTIKPDVLVYSSGTNTPQRSMAEISRDSWSTIVNVNLDGAFHAARSVLPPMRERGEGTIVFISSWAGWRLEPIAGAAYSTTKRALLALTEAINVEEGPSGIRVSCVCPAEVNTDVLNTRPVPPTAEARAKMLQADDIGHLVGFIASAPARMCFNEVVVSPTTNNFYRRNA